MQPVGVTERLMLARGFSGRMVLGLAKHRVGILTYETVRPGGKIPEAGKMQITAMRRSSRGRRLIFPCMLWERPCGLALAFCVVQLRFSLTPASALPPCSFR
jgi:hypothetical protein